MTCVICKHGKTRVGTTTVTFDRDGLTLVVKDGLARVCTNCGEDFSGRAYCPREILVIAERMAKSGVHVDVRRYASGTAMPC
ncbi:YgiT-type zinc finger protein [Methanoregula sp.]|uniref:YgiT-type zinc finger protein n=1 Tax=Methanoregula sp. TaxID=2052170 RepID=UPI0035679E7E